MKGRMRSLVLVSLLAVAMVMAVSASATIWIVGTTPGCVTIQNAIDSTSAGDTVQVPNETYTENLAINTANVTILSENGSAVTIIQGAVAGGVVIDVQAGAGGFKLGDTGKGFTVKNSTANNSTFLIQLVNGPNNVTIKDDSLVSTGNPSQGVSVGAAAVTGLQVRDNAFILDGGDVAIDCWGDINNLTVDGNTITGPADGNANADKFVEIAVEGATISNNTITKATSRIELGADSVNNVTYRNNSYSETQGGILIHEPTEGGPSPKLKNLDVNRNDFLASTLDSYGFLILNTVESADVDYNTVTVHFNNFTVGSGNTFEVVSNDATGTPGLDARWNYWNAYDGPSGQGPGTGDDISTNVDYSPWLGDTVGADPMTFHNDSTGAIQDALDSCGVGDTVKVYDGTYTENLEIEDDSVVLIAASSPIIDGNGGGPCIFVDDVDSVVIWGFTIQNGTEGIHFQSCSGGLVTLNDIKNNAAGGGKKKLVNGVGAGVLCECSDPTIEANNIDSNDVGVQWQPCVGRKMLVVLLPTINFNNIFDNVNYGVRYYIPDKSLQANINAEANYWGAADGPGPVGPGSGDNVSDNVDYEPWFTDTAAIHTVTDGTIDARSTANVEVDVNGTASVTVGQYSSNPGGAHTFTAFAGGYIDVHIEDTSEVNSITIRFYYPIAVSPEVGLALWWWDSNNWLLCSDQTLNTTDILPDYGGYIEVTITDNTTPSLADLLGQPFGGGSTPVVPFYPPIAFVIFAVLIAVATVIYLKRRKLVTD